MARLFHDGFEYNNTTANYPWTINASGAASYVTTTVRNGTYAGEINNLVSANRAGWLMQFLAAAGTGPYFIRFYINVTTRPSSANTIFAYTLGSTLGSTQSLGLKLNSNGTLGIYNAATQIGSNGTTVLSNGTWYMIEMKFSSVGGAGASIGELRINGVVELTSSTQTWAANPLSFMLGGNLKVETQTTGKWTFEDVAVNDSVGSAQTGYPGQGNIIRLKPNAAGDNNQFEFPVGGTAGQANNYTRVNAVSLAQAATLNSSLTNGKIDDFNVDDTPGALVSGYTINVVTVDLAAKADDVTGAAPIKPRIKKAASGTVSSGTVFTPPITSALVVNKASAPWVPTLVLYNDPDGNPWTKATLDTAQVGYTLTGTGTCNSDATSVSIQVDFSQEYLESASIKSKTTLSAAEIAQYVISIAVTSKTTLSSVETVNGVESTTIKSKTTPSGPSTEQSVESATCRSRTLLSGIEVTPVESSSIKSKTTPSALEITAYTESALIKSKSTLSTIEIAQYVNVNVINSKTTLSSVEITTYTESKIVKSNTSLSGVETLPVEFALIKSNTTLSSTEISQSIEFNTITSKSNIISIDLKATPEAGICTNKTTITSSEITQFTEAAALRSRSAPSASEVSQFAELAILYSNTTLRSVDFTSYRDSGITNTITKLTPSEIYTQRLNVDTATIRSITTIITYAEVQLIIELVGNVIKRYNTNVSTHFDANVISHFNARAVI